MARLLAVGVMVGLFVAACGADESTTSISAPPASTAAVETSATPTTSPPIQTTSVPEPPSTRTAPLLTSLEVAESWIGAYERGDVDAFQALMHPDATGNCINCGYERKEEPYFSQIGEGTVDVTDSRLLALGDGTLSSICLDDGTVVSCEIIQSSNFGFFTETGEPTNQFEGVIEFTIEDGLVTRRILIRRAGTAFDFVRVSDYEKWLKENEPDTHADAFFLGSILLTTQEQFEVHQRFVPQFFAQR